MSAPTVVPDPAGADDREVARALARAAMYRLLALSFVYPSPSTLGLVSAAAEQTARTAAPDLAEALRDLAAAARTSDLAEVVHAYAGALERPGGCSPYEGSYGTAPLLAGKGAVLADIAGFYAAFGMTPGERAAEIEDHIAAELEFMSVLAVKEAAALAEGLLESTDVTRSAEVAFLRDHLGRWGASFAEALRSLAGGAYLARASDVLTRWLAADMDALGVEAAPLEKGQPADREEGEPFSCPMARPS